SPFGFKLNPVGSVPEKSENRYGGYPPVAVMFCEYGEPKVPVDNGDDGFSVIGAAIFTCTNTVVESGVWLASVTSRLKPNAPAVVGVPVSTPAVDNVRPGGKLFGIPGDCV